MVYPANFMLLSFGGPIWDGPEQWSTSLRSTPTITAGGSQVAEQEDAERIAGVLATWYETAPVNIRADLAWMKWNLIGPNGRYLNPWTNLVEYTPVVDTSLTGAPYPSQIACVATLLTEKSRGLACRGRMYLPGTNRQMGVDGRLSASDALAIATSVAGLISSLNATEGYGLTEIVSNVGAGAQEPVTGVSVGRVLDTMRSRRTQLLEERSVPAAVAAGG